MRFISYFILTLISINTYAQSMLDTVYTNKELGQVVFIDKPNSKFHKLVFNFLLPDLEQNLFANTQTIGAEDLKSRYFGDWITVKKFQGRYFAYLPSEPFYNTFFRLSDSTITINDFNESFITYRINNKRGNLKNIKIAIVVNEKNRHFVSIRQISNSLFIVKSSLFNVKKQYFVKKNSYFNYPIIVNNCPSNRCPEFDFR